MSEIEKMYENYGIYPDCRARECGLDYCANSSGCGYAVYPDFTAEKQIELIKWLSSKYGIYIVNVDKYSIGFGMCIGGFRTKENFEEALAESINSLWQDLTEEEKQQVKEILK